VNPAFKHVAERVLVASGVAGFGRRRSRGRTLVLAYHNVLPEGFPPSGDLSLHLPQREFARQLDHLAQSHDVVSINALSDGSTSSQRPRVIITFDDAYAGALTCGVDELVRRGMSATIFVSPALLGSVPWWDLLADRSGGVVPDDLRTRALHALGGEGPKILADPQAPVAVRALRVQLPEIGTELQLSEAASRPGISLGSHTWSHPNLVALQTTAMESELTRPVEWLHARFRSVVPWLSYPYGLFADSVQAAAKRTGHLGAFRIDGGWIPRAEFSSYAIPRLNIPAGLSINGFRLRLAGF
jgi:peptidoglycan/xylan/chitin deacetylase (PgdA/CDA1 family)